MNAAESESDYLQTLTEPGWLTALSSTPAQAVL